MSIAWAVVLTLVAVLVAAARASALANAQTEIDVATFTQWVDAYATKEHELANF